MTSKYLYGAAAAALLLSACAQDEVVNMRQDGINYNVIAKNQTRAADSYCNINLPGHFNVWARTADDKALYINGDKIVRNNDGSWSDKDGMRYWPQGKNLDFFAHVNGDGVFNYNNGVPKFDNFKVEANVPDQLDLMYAVENNAAKSSAPVTINFRHALSQVCFRATNNTKNLQVTINSVTVGHLTDGGTYTYPTASTTENIVDPGHDDENNNTVDKVRGGWILDNNYNNKYTASVNGNSVTLASGDVNTNLTCPEANHANGFVNVMTLMPQQVNAWDPSNKTPDYNGAYFLLDVVIENVVDGGDNTTVYSGGAVVPVNVNWKEGYRYIYTFIFDEGGNGGFTPTPDNPQPVLTGIQYNVTVDDFIPVNGDGSGTGMDTGYKYSGIVKLHSNYGTDAVTQAKINTNNPTYTFTFGSEYTPTRTGYTFQGWASTANATTADFAVNTNTSLTLTEGAANTFDYYAVWKQETKESVITLQNGTGATPETQTAQGEGTGNNVNVTLPRETPTKADRTFEGWKDSEGNIHYPGDVVSVPAGKLDIVYTAVWSKSVTLSYQGNGSGATGVPENQTVKFDENSTAGGETTISSTKPTREGWIFKGWATSPTATTAEYPENVSNAKITINQDTILYAVWEQRTTSGDYPNTGY